MVGQDYYKILDVPKDAQEDQIKAAYRKLAFKYHPDRNTGNAEAMNRMKQVNEAYAVLSDPVKKRDYDTVRRQFGSGRAHSQFRQSYSDQDIFRGTDIHAVFNEMARSFGFRNFDDLSREVFTGKGNTFEFKKQGIDVKGVFFAGSFNLGKSPLKNALPGLLGKAASAFLGQLGGDKIPAQGKDLHDTIRISPDLAEKGGPYAYYHHWQSKKLVIQIPPKTMHGKQIRLSGMGQKGSQEEKHGDLYLRVETNTSLADRLKKLLPF